MVESNVSRAMILLGVAAVVTVVVVAVATASGTGLRA